MAEPCSRYRHPAVARGTGKPHHLPAAGLGTRHVEAPCAPSCQDDRHRSRLRFADLMLWHSHGAPANRMTATTADSVARPSWRTSSRRCCIASGSKPRRANTITRQALKTPSDTNAARALSRAFFLRCLVELTAQVDPEPLRDPRACRINLLGGDGLVSNLRKDPDENVEQLSSIKTFSDLEEVGSRDAVAPWQLSWMLISREACPRSHYL